MTQMATKDQERDKWGTEPIGDPMYDPKAAEMATKDRCPDCDSEDLAVRNCMECRRPRSEHSSGQQWCPPKHRPSKYKYRPTSWIKCRNEGHEGRSSSPVKSRVIACEYCSNYHSPEEDCWHPREGGQHVDGSRVTLKEAEAWRNGFDTAKKRSVGAPVPAPSTPCATCESNHNAGMHCVECGRPETLSAPSLEQPWDNKDDSLEQPAPLTEDDLCQIAKENRDLIPIVTELAAELREDFAIAYSLGNGQFEGLEGHLWGLVHMARAEVGDSEKSVE